MGKIDAGPKLFFFVDGGHGEPFFSWEWILWILMDPMGMDWLTVREHLESRND